MSFLKSRASNFDPDPDLQAFELPLKERYLVFRHDLDGMNYQQIQQLFDFESQNKLTTSSFALIGQIQKYYQVFRSAVRLGFEIGLHTESQPFFLLPNVSYLRTTYSMSLCREFRRAIKYLDIIGHCEHGINNYSNMFHHMTADIIESATIGTPFKYIVDYRSILITPAGHDFTRFYRPHILKKNDKVVVVFSTHFEDRFFNKYDDDHLLANPRNLLPHEKMLRALDAIEKIFDLPLSVIVISLHPINFLQGHYDGFRLMYHIKALAENKGILITSFEKIIEKIEEQAPIHDQAKQMHLNSCGE